MNILFMYSTPRSSYFVNYYSVVKYHYTKINIYLSGKHV